MGEAYKDWMMIRMVSGRMFLLVRAHPGSPGQRAVNDCCCCLLFPTVHGIFVTYLSGHFLWPAS